MADTRKRSSKRVSSTRRRSRIGKQVAMPGAKRPARRSIKPTTGQSIPLTADVEAPKSQQPVQQPDISPDIGPESEGDSWSPDGWDQDNSAYDESNPESKTSPNDEDESALEEDNKTPEKSLADSEKDASVDGGQDNTVVSEEEDAHKNLSAWDTHLANTVAAQGEKKRRRNGAFALLGGGGLALAMLVAVATAPQVAIRSFTEKITSAFSDRVEYAIDETTEALFEKYVSDKIVPTLNECGTLRNRSCVSVKKGTGLAGKAVASWSQNRIEDRLFERYGIDFELDSQNPNRVRMLQGGAVVAEGGPRTIASNSITQVKDTTESVGVRDRWLIRRILSSKYDARLFCFLKCAQRDELTELKVSSVQKLKLRLAGRISNRVGGKIGAYVLCLTANCNPEKLTQEIRDAANGAFEKYDDIDLKAISGNLEKRSLSRIVTDKAINKALQVILRGAASDATIRTAVSSIPGFGQIYLTLTLVDMFDRLDQAVKSEELSTFVEGVVEESYTQYYAYLASGSDGAISNEVPLADIGGMFQLISGFNQSRVWGKINNSPSLGSIACNNDYVIASNSSELTCPENNLEVEYFFEEWRQNKAIDLVFNIKNTYGRCYGPTPFGCIPFTRPRDVVRPALDITNRAIEGIASTIIDGIKKIDPTGLINQIENAATAVIESGFSYVIERLAENAADVAAEGFKVFDQVAAGANIVFEEFARGIEIDGVMTGLNAPIIDEQQELALGAKIYEKNQNNLESKNFFDRYFNVANIDSLASRSLFNLSTVLPVSKPISLRINPLTSVESFSNIFGFSKPASAGLQDIRRESLFGKKSHAYSAEELEEIRSMIQDDTLNEESCALYEKAYNDKSNMIEIDGKEYHTKSNPCQLVQTTIDVTSKIDNLDLFAAGQGLSQGTGTTGQDIASYIDGNIIPCQGDARIEAEFFGPGQNAINWEKVANSMIDDEDTEEEILKTKGASGVIGQDTNGKDMFVFVRDACEGQQDVRTVVIASSIHGSENGGQRVSFELLFNSDLPEDVRIVAIPEVNKSGIASGSRKNPNGVDLNRNFNFNWESSGSTDPSNNSYRGPSPASELETQNVQNFGLALGQTNLFMAYHDCINKVFYSGEKTYAQSRPIAEAYAEKFDGGTVNCGKKSWPWTSDPNRGAGFMEAWYADATNSPALLVELSNSESADYMKAHAVVVEELLKEGIIK